MTDYERIEKAIHYIRENFKSQPDLDEVAKQVHLSPFHFQRLFKEWAGVSPKKFLQYISVEYAKGLLKKQLPLSAVSDETGLSGTSRLHDLFINIESITPGEYKHGGEALTIQFGYAETPFGQVIIASTYKGICHLAFILNEIDGIQSLRKHFPNAQLLHTTDSYHEDALKIFNEDWTNLKQIKLHLKASPFQLKVWHALMNIPSGNISTYSSIAEQIQSPKASRAVGTAIGSNPVAYLIPCHRVIKNTGIIGEYHWGGARKTAILGWEAAQLENQGHYQFLATR